LLISSGFSEHGLSFYITSKGNWHRNIETLFRKRAISVLNTYVWRYVVCNVSYFTGLDIYFLEIQGDQKVSVHLTITVQKTRKNTVF